LSNRPSNTKGNAKDRSGGRSASTARAAGRSNPTVWIIAGVVAVIGLAAVVALVVSGGKKSNDAGTAVPSDPATLVSTISGVSTDTINAVGSGGVTALPKPIDAPDLKADGKPLVLYVGAEYCPYCAAERWGMVQALSRFGTFTGLTFTHSTPNDVFPNTPTLTFHGSTYTSSLISFQGVETQTNDGTALDTPTADQQALLTAYNPKGSIPWINFGGQYVISGASYSPGTLAGKSAEEVTAVLSDPGSAITKGIVGTANMMTATICILTGDQPGSVCSEPAVQAFEAQIKAQS